MEKPFLYRDLDLSLQSREIRLLKLLPAQSLSDDMRCTISHYSLDDSPTYEALSYVWGSEENKSSITVRYQPQHIAGVSQQKKAEDGDGSSGSSFQLEVTPNLHDALRHIRLPESERVMWIDAVCINQKSGLEKNHQVNLMRQIYKASKQVVLWLGEEKDSAIALNFLRNMPLQPKNGYADVRGLKLGDSANWAALLACEELFLGRPYWRRSWILQEVLHDRDVTVYIGTQKLPIEDLLTLFTIFFHLRNALISRSISPPTQSDHDSGLLSIDMWFRSNGASNSMPYALVGLRPRFKQKSPEEPRLVALLQNFRGQLAKEPKDKIYSLLGMAKKEYEIEINYDLDETKGGLTTRSLYTLTTRKMLARLLYVLLWVESPQREISSGLGGGGGLPSWVPDFTHKQQLTPRCLFSTITLFSADKGFPGGLKVVPASVSERCGIFSIRGVVVGTITDTHAIHVTKKWSDDPAEKDFDLLKLFWYELDPRLRSLRGTASSSAPLPVSRSEDLEEHLTPTIENTSWGPCMAEKKDILVVAAGCTIPLVLRRYEDKYLFVGGCWLIDSKIDVRELKPQCGELKGFSRIMYGSVVEQIGEIYQAEDFDLC
jgi:hypothetical protein